MAKLLSVFMWLYELSKRIQQQFHIGKNGDKMPVFRGLILGRILRLIIKIMLTLGCFVGKKAIGGEGVGVR